MKQILDIRDLATEWRDVVDDIEQEDDEASIAALQAQSRVAEALCRELQVDQNPDALEHFGDSYEPTLIHENYFTQYAQELAEEIGAVPSDLLWPLRCIDWDAAAKELQYDYTSVEYDGETYFIRSW